MAANTYRRLYCTSKWKKKGHGYFSTSLPATARNWCYFILVGLFGYFYPTENMVIMVFGALYRNTAIVIVVIGSIPTVITHIFAIFGFMKAAWETYFWYSFFSLYLVMMLMLYVFVCVCYTPLASNNVNWHSRILLVNMWARFIQSPLDVVA